MVGQCTDGVASGSRGRGTSGSRGREAFGARGTALALMLLLMLLLTVLGHGVLLLSMRELQATWAFRHALRAGEAAEAGLWLAVEGGASLPEERTPWIPHVLVSGETPDGITFRAVLRWLDDEFFLLEGVGGSRGWVGERRAGWVGWSLHPLARLAAFGAAAEVRGAVVLHGEARVEADGFREPPEGWPDPLCSGYEEVLDSLFPGGTLPALGPLPELQPEEIPDGDSIPHLGLLRGAELLERAGDGGGSESGSGSLPADAAWGCPQGSGPPAFLGTPDSFYLEQGRICGILVVGRDLRLAGDARVHGLVLVAGDLHLEEGAALEGMARVGGGLRLADAALFRSSACPVLRALEEVSVLKEPLLAGDGARINAF